MPNPFDFAQGRLQHALNVQHDCELIDPDFPRGERGGSKSGSWRKRLYIGQNLCVLRALCGNRPS